MMKRHRALRCAFASGLLVLAIAGCGTSESAYSEDQTHTPPSLSTIAPLGSTPTTGADGQIVLPTTTTPSISLPTVLEEAGITATIATTPEVETCVLTLALENETVGFPVNSAELSDHGIKLIEAAATLFLESPDVYVQGHSSSEGDAHRNQVLSRGRADAVALILRELISETRVHVEGLGSSSTTIPEKSEADRAQNRRVEISGIVSHCPET